MKNYLRCNIVPVLIGVLMGAIISLMFYPEYPEPEETVKVVKMPVYVEVETMKKEPEPIAADDKEQVVFEYLGKFDLTAYCGCEKCCGKADGITATGVKAMPEHTIAVDPNVIAYGTHVIINGHEYVAEDCGGIVNGNVVDIFFENHNEAVSFGKQKADVYVINKGGAE